MKPKTIMLIAGEASGDLLAAELVNPLREQLAGGEVSSCLDYQPLQASLQPRFIGAGGPRMAAVGVELAFDLTAHSVIGMSDVLKHFLKFRRLFRQLYALALDRQPEAIVCVDFSGFNRRFAHAIKRYAHQRLGWFHDWYPKLIQYVSPQVWASREGRAHQMARDFDLLLSIIPFEKQWYARRVPQLRVEFVGNPIVDRHSPAPAGDAPTRARDAAPASPSLLLLPGSRRSELQRHLPVMLRAFEIVRALLPAVAGRVVLPQESLVEQAGPMRLPAGVQVQCGGLAEAMRRSTLAIASTGTVTLECAWFGLPTLAIYRTSWSTYQIARQIVKVKYLAMPNLLADAAVFPEFIQHDATPENIAAAALELLRTPGRIAQMKARLASVVRELGPPGAARRAAERIARLILDEA